MKKLFTLLTFALLSIGSAWAQGTYALKNGDSDIPYGTAISSVDNITMIYGDGTTGAEAFKAPKKDESLKDILGATGFTEGNGINGNKTGGTIYRFQPTEDGVLTVGAVINSGKAILVKENGEDVDYKVYDKDGVTEVTVSDGKISAKVYGIIVLDVKAGKTYSVGLSGSKMGFYGFKYTLPATETFTVTFDAGSNGTCATTSLTEESVGAGVTLPAVTANSGYAFKAWYTAADGGSLAGKAGDTYYPSENITLYAQYGPAINRAGFNTYYVAEGDEVVSGTQVLCDDITMEYSTADYKAAEANNFISGINANYVAFVTTGTNGWGVTFTPSSDGVLSVGVVINKAKVFSITNASWFNYIGKQVDAVVDDVEELSASAGSIPSNTCTFAKKQYTIITIPVTAGTSYKFSVASSKIALYGFEFTKGASATASAVIGSTGWATFVAPAALDFTGISDVKAYIVTGHTGTAIDVEQMTGTVPANTPLLLEGVTTDVPTAASSSTDVSSNLLKAGGAEVSPEDGKTKYALSVEGGVATFKKIVAATTIPAGKAYLEFAEEIAAPSLSFGGTTGIGSIDNGQLTIDNVVYNLAGQRVAQPTKGLYIVNGKKVIVK